MSIERSLQSKVDLHEILDYLDQHAGPEISNRFLQAYNEELEKLAAMPSLGSGHPDLPRKHADVLVWPVTGFPSHLIFYKPLPDGIRVLRLMHGMRNLRRRFKVD